MSRRATIRTDHDDPDLLARALCPDNTTEMETAIEDGAVVTRIERGTTGGLHSNVDDYVVNLAVAIDVADTADERDRTTNRRTRDASDDDTNDNRYDNE